MKWRVCLAFAFTIEDALPRGWQEIEVVQSIQGIDLPRIARFRSAFTNVIAIEHKFYTIIVFRNTTKTWQSPTLMALTSTGASAAIVPLARRAIHVA